MDIQNRIGVLRSRLVKLRESCCPDEAQNSLVYEEAVSDLTTLIYTLETEQDQGDSSN